MIATSLLAVVLLVGAEASANPLWSQDDVFEMIDAAANDAATVLLDFEGTSLTTIDLPEEPTWGTPRCHLHTQDFFRLPHLDFGNVTLEALRASQATVEGRVTEALSSASPPGMAFHAPGSRLPLESSELGEALASRADADQIVFSLYWQARRVYEAEEGLDNYLNMTLINRVLCDLQVQNATFLYEHVLNYGFPTTEDVDGIGVASAILLAKHTDDLVQLNLVTIEAARAAGSGSISSTAYGYLLDTWSVKTLGRQAIGTHIRCVGDQPEFHPQIIDENASSRLRQDLGIPSAEELLEQLRRSCAFNAGQ